MEGETSIIKLENIKQEPTDELSISNYHITENQFHNSNDFVCNACHKRFCVPSSSRDPKFEIECPFCLKSFSSTIKEHVKYYKARGKEAKQKCNICSLKIVKHSLKRHLNSHVKPFECDLCSYRASRKDNLPLHMEIHGSSSSSSRKRSSYRTALKDKIVFQCKICKKCSESKYKIIEHIQFNHSGKIKKNVNLL